MFADELKEIQNTIGMKYIDDLIEAEWKNIKKCAVVEAQQGKDYLKYKLLYSNKHNYKYLDSLKDKIQKEGLEFDYFSLDNAITIKWRENNL